MGRILRRTFGGVGIFISRLFRLGIPLWFVILLLVGSVFGVRILTRNQVVREVGEHDKEYFYKNEKVSDCFK